MKKKIVFAQIVQQIWTLSRHSVGPSPDQDWFTKELASMILLKYYENVDNDDAQDRLRIEQKQELES